MNAYELLARHGEHAEGVVVPQVILRSERKSGEIGELTEVRRMHTTRVEGTPIMRDVVIGMLERPGKPPGLQRDDLITRRALGLVHFGLIAAGPGLQCGRSHGTCPPAFCFLSLRRLASNSLFRTVSRRHQRAADAAGVAAKLRNHGIVNAHAYVIDAGAAAA